MNEIRSDREANRIFSAWRIHRRNSANLQRDSFLRFASSAKAPRHARICRYLQIVGKHYRLCGGEGGIRTLGTGYPVRQISNLVPSTTRPPLRAMKSSIYAVSAFGATSKASGAVSRISGARRQALRGSVRRISLDVLEGDRIEIRWR